MGQNVQHPSKSHQKLRRHPKLVTAVLALTLAFSMLTVLLSNSGGSVLPYADGQTAWNTQTIATGGAFGPIYMAMDSANNPHVVYSGLNGVLYYATWEGSKWDIQSVILGGTPIQLVLDSHGSPFILYKGSNGVTYLATWNVNWFFQTVPSGYGYSLALDSADKPHLAYDVQLPVSDYPKGVTNNIAMLKYASWNGSDWNIQTVDKPTSYTDTVYLALDQQGNPHIMYGYDTYYPTSGGYIAAAKFAVWNGSSWSLQTAMTGLDYYGNMALDPSGNAHFIYAIHYPHETTINATLGYASWDGKTLQTQTVISKASLGLFTQANLALDSHNQPHIEFFNGSLMYASWTGINWNIQTVAPNNFAYGEGPLVLDSNNNPFICYWIDDIRNTTAFVSQLLMTSPTRLPTPQEPTPAPAPVSPSASATQLWEFKPAYSEIISPTVVDGRIYFLSGNSAAIPAALYCLDASTGAQIWNYSGILDGFMVADGYVYVGVGLPGGVVCLNAQSGAQVWNYSYGTDFGNLVVDNGMVYVGGQNYDVHSDTGNGFIYAFNASTGDINWIYSGPAQTRFDFGHLTVSGGTVYAVSALLSGTDSSWNGAVFAVDANSGKELWRYTAQSDFNSLAVSGQFVYVSSSYSDNTNYANSENVNGKIYQGGILALNTLDGSKVWEYSTDGSVDSFVCANNTVYAASGGGTVYAFNAANGTLQWSYTAGTGLGSLQVAGGYLYVGSSSGVYCLDANSGRVIWNFAASGYSGSSTTNPVFDDGLIYLGWNGPMFFSPATQHNFYALNAWNGQTVWNYTLDYTISATPIVMGGTVYVSGNFVSTRNPDFEGSGAMFALKSNVASLPFTPPLPTPTSTPTSTQSSPPTTSQTQNWVNPVLLGSLTLIAIVIVIMAIVLLKKQKHTKALVPAL